MKGKTKIILTNVETGEQEVHEDTNLITDALDKIINIEMAMNQAPNTHLLPIATKALGGLMLFDGPLTEDPSNIHFPVDAHLVGYANQSTNTTDKYRGSYNTIESGKTDTGFVSVWDFGTTQANGTIKAIARTHTWGGACPLFYYLCEHCDYPNTGDPSTDTGWSPIRYDGEYLYMLRGDSSTHLMRLARVRIPCLRMGVADYSYVARTYEVIASWTTEVFSYTYYTNDRRYSYDVTIYADSPSMYEDGMDGKIYCMFHGVPSGRDTDYQYDMNYFTIRYDDESYDKSETVHAKLGLSFYAYSVNSNAFYPGRSFGHVHNGLYYVMGGKRKTIHIVPLNNLAAFRTIRILSDDEQDYIYSFNMISPCAGGVYFEVYHYTTSSYQYRNGFLYPDGVYIIPDVSYSENSRDRYSSYRTLDRDLTAWGYHSYSQACRAWAANYLGTINNLATEIQKTAAQTMKIIYTLTDVDDSDSDSDSDSEKAPSSS